MSAQLIPQVKELTGHRVLCIGDLMLDRFVYGSVERISPEAPIPVIRVQREATTMGGGGNVVRNVVALGGHVDIIGVIGQDQAGYDLSNLIANTPEVVSYILTDHTRPTTVKTRYVSGGQQLLRADQEIALPISPAMEEQAIQRVKGSVSGCDAIIISDYAKGVLTPTVVQTIIKLAREHNKPLLIDPKGKDFSRYKGAYMLTPNRKELTEATGLQIKTVDDAEKASRILIEKYDFDGILAKLSGDGVCLVMKDESAQHFRAEAKEVYDVSGAGDTVVATMALALAGGLSLSDAAVLSNLAGSVVVGKVGTATVSQEDLTKAMLTDTTSQSEKKVLATEDIVELSERWRRQGLKVGFTNGVFDLLHAGHLFSIRQARSVCDRLIVGINSDSSTLRQKNKTPPTYDEGSRALLLAALTDIDAVVVFDEDTPVNLIKAIHPNVLIKGGNYSEEEVIGSDVVKSWGGEVVLTKILDGHAARS